MTDVLREYNKLAGQLSLDLTHNGDIALNLSVGEALIHAAARERNGDEILDAQKQIQLREDAEATANYILGLNRSKTTPVDQHTQVRLMLAISEQSDEEIKEEGFDRASVTVALQGAVREYLTAQETERRKDVVHWYLDVT